VGLEMEKMAEKSYAIGIGRFPKVGKKLEKL
jgi:hypothetical protein